MSLRPKRALVGLAVAAAALAAVPASALAAGEQLSVTPTNTQAGGATDVSATLTFNPADTPNLVTVSLARGMLGNLNANPSCLVGTAQLTPSCNIGNVVVHTNFAGDVPGSLYLVPPQGTDAAGMDVVTPLSATPQYIGVTLNPTAPGGLNLTTQFPNPGKPLQITGFTANFKTLNGQEFTRLPSNCAAAVSSFSATYYNGAAPGSAPGSFTPTGCNALTYAPKLSATVTKDASDTGAAMVFGITQAATESASKSIVLQLPKGLQPNVGADIPCLSAAGCQIGTASATAPLIPTAVLASGTVRLSGSSLTPTISIAFPAPFAITINGTVSLASNSVTFAAVPDVPLTSLTLNITGPGNQKAFNVTDCAPANLGGTFTPQSGTSPVSVTAPIRLVNCAQKPTTTGSTGGLAGGHPRLKFKITRGQGAANIAAVAIGLPGGLSFSHSAIVSHKVCTVKNKKKKCSTTTLIKGLGIAGARASSVAIKGGKLVITFQKPAASVTIAASGPLVSETKAFQTKVKKHRVKTLTFGLKVTDAKRTASNLSLKLGAH